MKNYRSQKWQTNPGVSRSLHQSLQTEKQEAYLLFQLSRLHAHIAKLSQLIGLKVLIDMQINRSSRAVVCGISHFYWVPWSFKFFFLYIYIQI